MTLINAACTVGGTLQQSWVSIIVLIALAGISIAGLLYAIANFAPGAYREKMKLIARFEIVQAALSLIILLALIGVSSSTCSLSSSISSSLIGSAADPFTFARYYVGNLLFNNGVGLIAQAYTIGINYAITAATIRLLESPVGPYWASIPGIGNLFGTTFSFGGESNLKLSIELEPSTSLSSVYAQYGGFIYGGTVSIWDILSGFVSLTFAVLLAIWLLLPVVQATGLVLIVPIALAMRMIGFISPRVRNLSNSIFAVALAFFFIYPMTIVFNAYAVGWLYCTNGVSPCNPYTQYVGTYNLQKISVNSLFTSNKVSSNLGGLTGGTTALPASIFSSLSSGVQFLLSSGSFTKQLLSIIDVPVSISNYSDQVAQYILQGIVFMALDLAITIGFAVGLAKSFNAVSEIMGEGGSVWGGV